MKKVILLLLTVVLLLGMAACGDTRQPVETQPQQLQYEDPRKPLTNAMVDNFPVATDEMTTDQLRQLCLEFFKLQLGFQWKPDTDISFQMSNYKKGTYKDIKQDELYGGVVYHSKGFGNVYRWLEYYDEATGVLDLSGFLADNGGFGEGAEVTDVETNAEGNVTYQKYRSLMALGNQCTSASCWSWGRVINSVNFGDTCDLNVYNGYIPVGGYTYGYTHEGKEYGMLDIQMFGEKSETNPLGYDTPDVIDDWNKANGDDAMFECYAQMKPADCLVNEGHALMVKDVKVQRDKNGKIIDIMSIVTVNEQVEAWTSQDETLNQQGTIEKNYTFAALQEDDYIPFTFRELLDENDEADKKHIDIYNSFSDKLVSRNNRYEVFDRREEMWGDGVEKAVTYCTAEGDSISAGDFEKMVVGSNYSISDVFVTVTDGGGNVMQKNIYRADFSHYREVPMTAQKSTWEKDENGNYLTISAGIAELTGHTVTVTMQLSNGELLTAYIGTITE